MSRISPILAFPAELLADRCPVQIVDIGANPIGGDVPYRALMTADIAPVTCCEPQEAALADLQSAKLPGFVNGMRMLRFFPLCRDEPDFGVGRWSGAQLARLALIAEGVLFCLEGLSQRGSVPQSAPEDYSERLPVDIKRSEPVREAR